MNGIWDFGGFDWNRIGVSDASSLSQASSTNSPITSLDLSENSIGDSGATSPS